MNLANAKQACPPGATLDLWEPEVEALVSALQSAATRQGQPVPIGAAAPPTQPAPTAARETRAQRVSADASALQARISLVAALAM